MKIIPLGDRALVKAVEIVPDQKGKIYIPDQTAKKGRIAYGEIIALGEGPFKHTNADTPFELKLGMVLCFKAFSGAIVDDDHRLLEPDDILGRVGG